MIYLRTERSPARSYVILSWRAIGQNFKLPWLLVYIQKALAPSQYDWKIADMDVKSYNLTSPNILDIINTSWSFPNALCRYVEQVK